MTLRPASAAASASVRGVSTIRLLNEDCAARAQGTQESFPRKAPKKSGTLRRGGSNDIARIAPDATAAGTAEVDYRIVKSS